MIEWNDAKAAVEKVFFNDEFILLPKEVVIDDIGEEIAKIGSAIGSFSCNAQYQPISKQSKEQGLTANQTLRLSCIKEIPLVRGESYAIKLTKARIQFDPNEVWEVTDWIESQLSTVIMCGRKEIV